MVRCNSGSLSPIRLFVVLQKFSPDVRAGVDAGDDRVHDARRAVSFACKSRGGCRRSGDKSVPASHRIHKARGNRPRAA